MFLARTITITYIIFLASCADQGALELPYFGDNAKDSSVQVVVKDGSKNPSDDITPADGAEPNVPPLVGPGGLPLPPLGLCGDDIVSPDEECDDGNNKSGDGCSKDCLTEKCGDGIVNDSEENCDDGNRDNGDGCDKDCQTEYDFVQSARTTLDVGNTTTCYKSENLWQLKCWGSNNQGELGQEDTAEIGNGIGDDVEEAYPIKLGSGISAAVVSTGGSTNSKFTCVVTSAGSLKCFGDNSSGQLGKGDTADIGDNDDEMGNDLSSIPLGSGREAQDVDTGGKHVCALLDNDSVKCFGENNYGQLGQEDTEDRGDESGELGNNLVEIDLGTGRSAKMVATGQDFSCAILDDDSLKCWGRNQSGQLGQENTDSLGDNVNEMGDNLAAIDLGTNRTASQVVAGAQHVCALLDDDSVKCFGANNEGQLGQGHTDNLGDNANEMGDNLVAIDLGTGRTARQIAAGDFHTCALLDNYDVKCFGRNLEGQLGQEDDSNLGDQANEMGDDLDAINLGNNREGAIIAAGGSSTCVILDNDDLVCFGENNYGQLGIGNTEDIGDEPDEMGNDLKDVVLGF